MDQQYWQGHHLQDALKSILIIIIVKKKYEAVFLATV